MQRAFLDAVRWGASSSADVRNIQSPFRSGIDIEDYQLDPVVRAIQMPRVNLLIADDVGLGKTIEAGLILRRYLDSGFYLEQSMEAIASVIFELHARRYAGIIQALAGKGFTKDLEAAFRDRNKNADFATVDRMESYKVTQHQSERFIKEGSLRLAEGGAQ